MFFSFILSFWLKSFTGPGSLWWSWTLGFLERCIPDIDYGMWELAFIRSKRIPLIVSALDHRWAILPFNSCCMKPCWKSWSKAVPWTRMVTMGLLLWRLGFFTIQLLSITTILMILNLNHHFICIQHLSVVVCPSIQLINYFILLDISPWCSGKTRSNCCDLSSFSCEGEFLDLSSDGSCN